MNPSEELAGGSACSGAEGMTVGTLGGGGGIASESSSDDDVW